MPVILLNIRMNELCIPQVTLGLMLRLTMLERDTQNQIELPR